MDAAPDARKRDMRVIGLVGVAHFFSHLLQLALPPLFPLIRAEADISYTRLGLLLSVLYLASGGFQTPAGFLVDRIGAGKVLVGGLAMLGAAITLLGVAPGYGTMLALAFVAGLGNSVFHPADYAIMSTTVSEPRMGRAFSIHGFGGHLGYAAAPALMIALGSMLGWRGALIVVGLCGVAVALVLGVRMEAAVPAGSGQEIGKETTLAEGLRLLFQAPVLIAFLFFVLMAMALIGLQSFTSTALTILRDFPLATANLGLTWLLVGTPLGILGGGILADRIQRHGRIAFCGMLFSGIMIAIAGLLRLPPVPTMGAFLVAGLFFGMALPSRDMVVRAITPKGASGKVFGFTYSGLDIGSSISPVLFGWFVDMGHALWVFIFAPLFLFAAAATILAFRLLGRPGGAPAR